MTSSLFNAHEDQTRLKVSIPLRLVTVVCCLLPVIGVIQSSRSLIGTFVALSESESASVSAIQEGLAAASFYALGSLYLGIVCGIVVIVVLMRRFIVVAKTASPPIWFFVVSGILYLVPTGIYWKAHLLVLEAINPNGSIPPAEMAGTGGYIANLLILAVVAALIVFIPLVVIAVLPLTSRSEDTRISLFGAIAVEILLIGTAIMLPV